MDSLFDSGSKIPLMSLQKVPECTHGMYVYISSDVNEEPVCDKCGEPLSKCVVGASYYE